LFLPKNRYKPGNTVITRIFETKILVKITRIPIDKTIIGFFSKDIIEPFFLQICIIEKALLIFPALMYHNIVPGKE